MAVSAGTYNEDDISDFKHKLLSGYSQINEKEDIELTTDPQVEKEESIAQKIFNFIYKISKEFINGVSQFHSGIKEIFPILFDNTIEMLLNYAKSTKSPLRLSFKQIFELFELIGLEEIQLKTFEKISACVQWKIISPDWIDLSVLEEYRNGLLSDASEMTMEAIDNLKEIVLMREREESEYRNFETELSRILLD